MWAIRKPRAAPGLALEEVPVPAPGDDEVLVRVEAASSAAPTCTSSAGTSGPSTGSSRR